MNQYLKYFIYFLLGVIIYYFLFNSTNAKSQKVIEGFDTSGLSTLLKKRRLYIKTPHKITAPGTEIEIRESNADGTFLNYDLTNTLGGAQDGALVPLTLDHFTKNPYESIIGAPDLKDSPHSLTAHNILELWNTNSGNIKSLSVLPDSEIIDASSFIIPPNLDLTFKLTNITPPIPLAPDEVELSIGLLPQIVYGDDNPFDGSLIKTLIELYDEHYIMTNNMTNNNTIVYGDATKKYYLIFCFISLDSEGNNDPFGNLDLFIITPDTISTIIGNPNSPDNSPISNSFSEFKGGIAKKIEVPNTLVDLV